MYQKSEIQKRYKEKLITAKQAAEVVKSGDRVSYGFGYSAPYDVDAALGDRIEKGELTNMEFTNTLTTRSQPCDPFLKSDSIEQARFSCAHFSGTDRKMNKAGRDWFIPMLFRELPSYWENYSPADVVIVQATPMDEWGNFNLGPALADLRGLLASAGKIILEVNNKLPHACGRETELNISEVDYVVEGSNHDIDEIPIKPASSTDEKIARIIVDMIEDGSTLQLGIGSLPTCIGAMLAESDVKDLHCHTEMMSDPYVYLYDAGKLTGGGSSSVKGKIVYSFAGGTKRLYDFIDGNQMCYAAPINYVNDVNVIAGIDKFISVNGCIAVDLYGQVCSESVGHRQVSGTGGQFDFVQGAYASKGGKSFICLHSTRTMKDGSLQSLIQPTLAEGSIITTPRSATHYVVTEYGAAMLKGKSTWERSEALINISHPELRDDLIKEAEKMGIWTKTSKTTY